MTELIARLRGSDEVEAALAGGADTLLVLRSDGDAAGGPYAEIVRATLAASQGRAPVWAIESPLDGADACDALLNCSLAGLLVDADRAASVVAREPRKEVVAVVREEPAAAVLDAIQASGARGVLLAGAGRIVDALGMVALARFAAACRHRGLASSLSGGLEAADVPRLVALGVDRLVFRRTLCAGRDPRRQLDGRATRLIRDLIHPRAPTQALARQGRLDRIFVRDFVLSMPIGAYASEVGRDQRVRFTVEAEVAPRTAAADDLRDIVSYDLITDAIRQLALGDHVELVETLAERIAERVLNHQNVAGLRVMVEKLDVGPGSVGVDIWRDRS